MSGIIEDLKKNFKDISLLVTIIIALGWLYGYYIENAIIGKIVKTEIKKATKPKLDKFDEKYLEMLNKVGDTFQVTGEYEKSKACYEESFEIAKEHENIYKKAESQYKLGNVYQVHGYYLNAMNHYEKSETICNKKIMDSEDINDITKFFKQKAEAVNSIGFIHYARGEFDQAKTFHKQALKLREEIGDKKGEAKTYVNLGMVEQALGNIKEAEDYYKKSIGENENLKKEKKEFNLTDIATAEKFLCSLYIDMGSLNKDQEMLDEAYTTCNKSLEHYEFIDDQYSKADLYNFLGVLYYEYSKICSNNDECYKQSEICSSDKICSKKKSLSEAEDKLVKTLFLRQEMGFRRGKAENLKDLGFVYLEKAKCVNETKEIKTNIEKARTYCNESLKICRDIGDRYGKGKALSCIGLIHELEGKDDAPKNKELEESRNIFKKIKAKGKLADLLLKIEKINKKKNDTLKFTKYENFVLASVFNSIGLIQKGLIQKENKKKLKKALKNFIDSRQKIKITLDKLEINNLFLLKAKVLLADVTNNIGLVYKEKAHEEFTESKKILKNVQQVINTLSLEVEAFSTLEKKEFLEIKDKVQGKFEEVEVNINLTKP